MALDGAIGKDDVFKDDLLKFPVSLADSLKPANAEAATLLKTLKSIGQEVTAAKSTTDLGKATSQLTEQEKQLIKIQNQISTAIVKGTDEYIAHKKGLDAVNQATKDKIVLGDKNAKTINAETSSIKQLDAALAKNIKTYQNLKSEQDRNSKSGKELKETILAQSKASQELHSSLGDSKEGVSKYREELEGLLVVQEGAGIGLEGLITKVRTLGKSFLTLIKNPIFLAFAALAAVVGIAKKAVETFFETTEEGEIIQEKLTATYTVFFAVVKKGFADLGKQISHSVGGADGISGVFASFLSSISPTLGALFTASKVIGDKIQKFNHELTERIIKDIAVKAKAELDADQLTLDSKDELKFNDAQRLDFAEKAFAIRKKQAEEEKAIAEEQLEQVYQQIAVEKVTSVERIKLAMQDEAVQKQVGLISEQKKRINEAIANVYTKQNDSLGLQRRLMGEISSLQQKITKAGIDKERAGISASSDKQKEDFEAQLKINEEIIKNNFSTQERITKAIYEASINRESIAVNEYRKEVSDANHAAEDRVRALGITNDEEIEDRVQKDAILKEKLEASQTKFAATVKAIDDKLAVDLNENVFTRLKKDFDNLNNTLKTKEADTINALEKAFLDSEVGSTSNVLNFEAQKKAIQKESQRQQLISLIDFLKARLKKVKLNGEEEIQVLKDIAEAEGRLTDLDVVTRLQAEQDIKSKKVEIQNSAFALGQEIIQAAAQKRTAQLDKELSDFQALQDSKQEALKQTEEIGLLAAGDSAEQKLSVERKYFQDSNKLKNESAAEEKKIQNEKNKLLRKAAIYQKALSLSQAGINIAQGETAALSLPPPESFIMEALVGIAGAVQIASILAQPIPQYFTGVESSAAGLAVVGERGTELIKSSKGDFSLTPNIPTLVDLGQGGHKIFDNKETLKILALAGMQETGGTVAGYNSQQDLVDAVNNLAASNGGSNNSSSTTSLYSNVTHVIEVDKLNEARIRRRRAKLL